MKENYEKPASIEFLKENTPHLLECPVHVWRAENGIELIHREPSVDEQIRIWKNWFQMPENMKSKSNEKSIDFFGVSNTDHHRFIMKYIWDKKTFIGWLYDFSLVRKIVLALFA
jgi:hypothetical protein